MGAKDWLIERAAVAMLNQSVLKPYGELKQLKLDSSLRRIEAELELKGEPQPVQLKVGNYEIVQEEGAAFLVLHEVSTSREWLTKLAGDFLVGRKLALPQQIQPFLPMLS